MKVKPVKGGAVFYFHIDFSNLSTAELAALIFAVRPYLEYWHKLGLGKPLGLGTVRLDPVGLFLVDRANRYSADGVLSSRYGTVWKSSVLWDDKIPDIYELEKKAEPNMPDDDLENIRSCFSSSVSSEISSALSVLGNPNNVTQPVRYPVIRGQDPEEETFKWFVANETARQSLNRISNLGLPTLNEL